MAAEGTGPTPPTRHFCYDANGNQLKGFDFTRARDRLVSYTPYNLPKTITEGATTVTLAYGADRNRFKQVNSATSQTTLYIDGIYERETVRAITTHVHYIMAGSAPIAIYQSDSTGVQKTRYLHRDHVGSVTHITNEAGGVSESLSYDPWGKRRQANWADAAGPIFPAETMYGYGGFEHLDSNTGSSTEGVTVIHMGDGVYDPDTSRMLTAAKYVPAASYGQSFNRYSYGMNRLLGDGRSSGN